ncbi:aromatic amino acid transport family protein [Pseudomonas sp. KnCO4]|uniref:aromatic amino acid transport family protein n=1 Tax=Pseudomonas sp. KnCO4 TaxID=3381355 RepID=UPI003877E670
MIGTQALPKISTSVETNKIPFTLYDAGWVVMCIGMAIGSGIVFMPLQMGVKGFWASAISLLIAYPAVYYLTKLYIASLSKSENCCDYAGIISQYLGKNWGAFLSCFYFFTTLKGMLGYSATITHDTATYLHHFGVTSSMLSDSWWYPLALLTALVLIASRGERLLFKVSAPFIVFKLLVIVAIGALMIPRWDISNVNFSVDGGAFSLVRDVIVSLPFALFSIVFIQVLNPMNVAYRKIEADPSVATYRALRASRVAYLILLVAILFFAFSFMFSITQEQARSGISQNTSALALVAQVIPGHILPFLSVMLSISAIMTSFFGIYLGFNDALSGIIINIADRYMKRTDAFNALVPWMVKIIAVSVLWCWVMSNINTMAFLQWTVGTFALVSCLIPCYLVYRVPALNKYKSLSVSYVTFMGVILFISPLFKLFEN